MWSRVSGRAGSEMSELEKSAVVGCWGRLSEFRIQIVLKAGKPGFRVELLIQLKGFIRVRRRGISVPGVRTVSRVEESGFSS